MVSGWILIDRCGKHFGTILNYLRDGTVALPETYRDIMELLAEAKYFLIEELTESCQQALTKKEREAEPICRVPLITSQKEEQLLIMSTSKVNFTIFNNYVMTQIFISLKISITVQKLIN